MPINTINQEWLRGLQDLLDKGGLRCEILSTGKISVNDKITSIK